MAGITVEDEINLVRARNKIITLLSLNDVWEASLGKQPIEKAAISPVVAVARDIRRELIDIEDTVQEIHGIVARYPDEVKQRLQQFEASPIATSLTADEKKRLTDMTDSFIQRGPTLSHADVVAELDTLDKNISLLRSEQMAVVTKMKARWWCYAIAGAGAIAAGVTGCGACWGFIYAFLKWCEG